MKIISNKCLKSAVFLSSLLLAKSFSRTDRKHFSLVTASCHSGAPCLSADVRAEHVRQTMFV